MMKKKKHITKKKHTTKKKISSKKKIASKKKLSKKTTTKKQTSKKKINRPDKKKILSKKLLQKIKKVKKLAFKIDLRKLTKEQRDYVKRLREGYKEGEFKKKFAKYMLQAVIKYLDYYKLDTKRLFEAINISKKTFNKLKQGDKVSKKTYNKFNTFLEKNFNSIELSFLFRIVDILKKTGKISSKRIDTILEELYEFIEPNQTLNRLSYYDYLHIFY